MGSLDALEEKCSKKMCVCVCVLNKKIIKTIACNNLVLMIINYSVETVVDLLLWSSIIYCMLL